MECLSTKKGQNLIQVMKVAYVNFTLIKQLKLQIFNTFYLWNTEKWKMNLQYLIFKIFWSQSPPNSTGRDKCNTIQKHSIATDPNLCRKGFDFPLLFYRLFTTTVSFAWICTAEYHTAGCKPAKLTIEQCSVTGQFDWATGRSWSSTASSTLSAHNAVDN